MDEDEDGWEGETEVILKSIDVVNCQAPRYLLSAY